MKRLIYQVKLGKNANSKLYDFCIESVKEYCKQHGIDHFVQTQPLVRISPDPFMTNRSNASFKDHGGFLPIYEKENAFKHLGEYDEIAVIDADIFIRPNSSNLFDQLTDNVAFMAATERDMPLTSAYTNKIINYARMQYTTLTDVNWDWNSKGADYHNMGVMLFNKNLLPYLREQTPKQFLNRYEFKRFIDGVGAWKWSTDQTLLNWWIKKERIPFKKLDWKYNGLFTANTKISECEFVHFFLKDKLPHRGEDLSSLMQMI